MKPPHKKCRHISVKEYGGMFLVYAFGERIASCSTEVGAQLKAGELIKVWRLAEASLLSKRDHIASICGAHLAACYVRAQINSDVISDKREDYILADVILEELGLQK